MDGSSEGPRIRRRDDLGRERGAVVSTRTPDQILDAIADEIEQHPERWIQGDRARDAYGNRRDATDSDAVCWCAYGFMQREVPSDEDEYLAVCSYVEHVNGGAMVVRFNDAEGRKPAEVVALFRKAAEIARAAK
jgi:hypothetical protein